MRLKQIIIFAFLLLFFSSMPFVLADKIWEGKDLQSTFNNAKNNYQSAIGTYKQYRGQYLEALNKYKALQCKDESQPKCKEAKDKAIEKAKQYLLKVKDTMAKYLTTLKSRIESLDIENEDKNKILDEITQDLSWLDTKETEINNLQTADQVKEMANALKTFWQGEEAKVKKYIGNVAVWKIEKVAGRFDEIANKIQDRINELDKEDYDIDDIQGSLNDIKKKIESAKTKAAEAKVLFNDPAKFDEGKTKIKEAAKILKDVFSDLKSFVGEVNKEKLKKKEVSGTGFILVKGEGFVSMTGNGEISGKVGNEKGLGTVTITDKDKDSQIETFGKGDKVDMGDGRIQYKGVEQIQIKGSDIVVEISSQFIDIEAKGTGTVTMKGDGLYKASGKDWTDIPNTNLELKL